MGICKCALIADPVVAGSYLVPCPACGRLKGIKVVPATAGKTGEPLPPTTATQPW